MKLIHSGMAMALLGIAQLAQGPAQAQQYPAREIRLICGFAAGSGADVMYRFLANKLQTVAGKPFVVENRPGAMGNIANVYVARSKPDGYTILPSGGSGLASMKYIMKNPPVDALKDFDYIGTIMKQGWYLSVDVKSPIKTLAELTQKLKKDGANASYSTATSIGTVFAELYKAGAGLQTVRVNYRTIGDSMNDLSSGVIAMAMSDPPFTIANIRNGRIRALAVSTPQRVAATPDIPTMAELGYPEVDVGVWWGIQVAAGTPKPIRDTIGKWFEQVLKMEETVKFFKDIGSDVFISTPEETRALVVRDMKKWSEFVVKARLDPM